MTTFTERFRHNSNGATAIEYALIASMIALVIVGAITALGGKVQLLYNNIAAASK